MVMKQEVAPLQAEEVNNLRRKLANFDVRQHEFRESFREKAPFAYSATHPYIRINRVSLRPFHTFSMLIQNSLSVSLPTAPW